MATHTITVNFTDTGDEATVERDIVATLVQMDKGGRTQVVGFVAGEEVESPVFSIGVSGSGTIVLQDNKDITPKDTYWYIEEIGQSGPWLIRVTADATIGSAVVTLTDILGINGTFESTPGWMTQSNTVARTGTYSGRIGTPAGESFSYTTLDITNPNPDADAYWLVQGYMRPGTADMQGFIGGKEGATSAMFQVMKNLASTSTWYPFRFQFRVLQGANLRLCAAAISSDGATAGQFLYFDDITCTRIGTVVPEAAAETGFSIVGGDGEIHRSDIYACRVYKASNFSHNSSGAWLSVTFGTEARDDDLMHAIATGSYHKIYIPESGWYLLTANVEWDTNTTGFRTVRFSSNGKNGAGTSLAQTRQNAQNGMQQNLSHVEYLVAGEYVVLDLFQNSGGTVAATTNGSWAPSLSVAKLS
jgi:hypothetical protein